MGNPIFDNQPKAGTGSIFDFIKGIQNPQQMFDNLYSTNPQFRDFANSMKGKTPEQAFRENGFDYNQFRGMNSNR